ncbi:MAG: hypothetical protein AAFO01_03740 [Pseudomonadota bacterium]
MRTAMQKIRLVGSQYESLKGQVMLLPGCNPLAFGAGNDATPEPSLDGMNLSRQCVAFAGLDRVVGSILLMPIIVCILALINLAIWPVSVSAQTHQQSASVDHGPERASSDDWIATWVRTSITGDAGLRDVTVESAERASDVNDAVGIGRGIQLEDTVLSDRENIKQPEDVATTGLRPQQNKSDLVDQNEALRQQLEATRKVLAIFDAQAAEALRENELLVAEAEQSRQRITSLERELSTAVETIKSAKRDNDILLAELVQLRQQTTKLGSSDATVGDGDPEHILPAKKPVIKKASHQSRADWIAELIGYHPASFDVSREVEISAHQEKLDEALTKHFQTTFGPNFALPNLDAFGVSLIGGHVTTINGAETGRIVYRDADNNTLDFWLVSKSGRASQVSFGEQNDLNFVHWGENHMAYALIGPLAWRNLAPIAGELHQRFRQ